MQRLSLDLRSSKVPNIKLCLRLYPYRHTVVHDERHINSDRYTFCTHHSVATRKKTLSSQITQVILYLRGISLMYNQFCSIISPILASKALCQTQAVIANTVPIPLCISGHLYPNSINQTPSFLQDELQFNFHPYI